MLDPKHYLPECSRRETSEASSELQWLAETCTCLLDLICFTSNVWFKYTCEKKCRSFRCLIECRDEYKYNVEAVELLIRNHLVNMQQYDLHLAQVKRTCFFGGEKCQSVLGAVVSHEVNG